MKDRSKSTKTDWKNTVAFHDMVEIGLIAILAFVLTEALELVETINKLAQEYEAWPIYKFITVPVIMSFAFGFFALRRWKELRQEIAERKQAEEKLKETMEIKSQFISTVSHELRTPLTCMKEAIAVLLDGVVGKMNNKQRDFLDIAKRNIDRLAELINDVLDFQKFEAGEMHLNVQENDIKDIVGELHKAMVPSAKKRQIDFSIKLEDNLPKARFDNDKIIQVLTNLVSNAINFTPEHGKISICVQHQDQDLVITVSDTGMGIPKEALPKIFDRFYRVHRHGKQSPGTGLGLAIVKNIVMMHGGRIEVESKLSQGTTFTVFLPLDAKSEQQLPDAKKDEILEESLANANNQA